MNKFKYHPYYKYDGASLAQPFREELTPEEVEYNLACFFDEVERYFEDDTATFTKAKDNCIEITTALLEKECDELVKRCLNSLDLFAHKIK